MSHWSFAQISPSALAMALAATALLTLGLYLLRLRRQPLHVAFIELWQSLILEKKAAALRSQLKRWLSLLLSLLLAWALLLAFSDPHPADERRGRHIVVLIDAGALMSEKANNAASNCLNKAQAQVEQWLLSLGPGDEMLLVEMGAEPRPLDSFTGDRARLLRALRKIQTLDVVPDLQAALLLARDAVQGRSLPEIIVLSTDELNVLAGQPAISGLPPLRFANLSSECAAEKSQKWAKNLGIELFSARRYPLSPGRFEVLLNVRAQGKLPIATEITIHSVGSQGEVGPVLELLERKIEPGISQSLSFTNLSQAAEGLIAHVKRADGELEEFTSDNWARAVLPARLPVRVLLVGLPDNFLEAALLLEESLIVKRVAQDEYPPAEEFDVTIFNATAPARVARTGAAIYLGVPDKETVAASDLGFPVGKAQEIAMFGFDTWDRKSAIFKLIDPYDVQVLKGFALQPAPGDVVLGSSEGRPIFVSGTRGVGRFLALGFEPQHSDFVLRAAWPLFVINMIDELYPRGRGETMAVGRVAQQLRVAVPDARASMAEVVGPIRPDLPPRRHTAPVVDGYAIIYSQEAGFFDISTGQTRTRFVISAAAFVSQLEDQPAAQESGILAQKLGPYAVTAPQGMQPRSNHDPWFWCLVVVVIVSYLEWWAYHRRWTV